MFPTLIPASVKRRYLDMAAKEKAEYDALPESAKLLEQAKTLIEREINTSETFPFKLLVFDIYCLLDRGEFPIEELKRWLANSGYSITINRYHNSGTVEGAIISIDESPESSSDVLLLPVTVIVAMMLVGSLVIDMI